jgi:hypothetical protein
MATNQESPSAKPVESPAFPGVEDAKFPSKSTTNSIILISVVIAAVVAVFAMFSPKVGPANEMNNAQNLNPNAETQPIRQTADPSMVGQGQTQAPVNNPAQK